MECETILLSKCERIYLGTLDDGNEATDDNKDGEQYPDIIQKITSRVPGVITSDILAIYQSQFNPLNLTRLCIDIDRALNTDNEAAIANVVDDRLNCHLVKVHEPFLSLSGATVTVLC